MIATTTTEATTNNALDSNLDLTLVITDPNILLYLSPFDSVEAKTEKAMEALKVGVIAIQSASPTLDTRVVQAKFTELETRLREHVNEFQGEITDHLQQYFKDGDGVVPRSIDLVFGPKGSFAHTMDGFFDPAGGRVSKLNWAGSLATRLSLCGGSSERRARRRGTTSPRWEKQAVLPGLRWSSKPKISR